MNLQFLSSGTNLTPECYERVAELYRRGDAEAEGFAIGAEGADENSIFKIGWSLIHRSDSIGELAVYRKCDGAIVAVGSEPCGSGPWAVVVSALPSMNITEPKMEK